MTSEIGDGRHRQVGQICDGRDRRRETKTGGRAVTSEIGDGRHRQVGQICDVRDRRRETETGGADM